MSDENPYSQFLPPKDSNPYAQFAPKPEPDVKPLVEHFQQHEAEGFMETVQGGLQSSVAGLALRGKMPDFTLPQDAGFFQRQEYNFAQIIPDIPVMAAGFVAGAAGGAGAGEAVAGPPAAAAGAVVGGGAGAFMLPTALRGILMDHYQNGAVQSWGDLWQRAKPILLSTIKSGGVGAATAGVGVVAKPLVEGLGSTALAATGSEVVASGVRTSANLATQATVLANAGAWVDGRTATLKDYEDAGAMLFGFHAAKEGSGKLMEIYRQTGIQPQQVVADAKNNPAVEIDLLTPGKTIPDAYKSAVDPDLAKPEASASPMEPETTTAKPIEKVAATGVSKIVKDLKDAYTQTPEFTDIKRIIGQYTGKLQEIDFELSKKAKELNSEIGKDRQVAITNHIQAGGNTALLAERETASHKNYKQGYADARSLTPRELEIATEVRQHQEKLWKLANDAGILEDYVDNYVRGQWDKPNAAGKKIISLVNSGAFRASPKEALHKVFQNYFEGEQAGFKPTNKAIGYQWIAAERSMRQAIEARKALKNMMSSVESDGRPTVSVGGSSVKIEGDPEKAKAYLVKPNSKGKDTVDYRYLPHPALRKWKWLGEDDEGKPILSQGDMWIHPDAFGRVNALLGRSRIREYAFPDKFPVVGGTRPGKAMLDLGGFIKGTILVGPFHQFNVGEHAVFHKVNPLSTPPIDFETRPLLREGVNHGLMLYSHNAMAEFGEGLSSGGLLHRLPVVGDLLKRYQEYLFQDYIPRLKAVMYEHAVERAEKYYASDLASGKFTRDQLLENAANQANAAFGELNYKYIGRDPTYQDALRIALLAPDFLEARLKFAGQALSPKGKEQLMALVRSALITATAAQAINILFADDHKARWDRPFSVVIGEREYSPRSVIADISHLVTDPRGFWYHRLNPIWGRPLIEMASGRNMNGQKVGMVDAAKDILKSWTPIPAQGLFAKSTGDTPLNSTINSLLQSIGVANFAFKTDAEKLASDISFGHMSIAGYAPEAQERHEVLTNLRDDYVSGNIENMSNLIQKAHDRGITLSVQQIKQFQHQKREGGKVSLQDRMKHFTAEESMQVWGKMTRDEKRENMTFMQQKLVRSKTLGIEKQRQYWNQLKADVTVH